MRSMHQKLKRKVSDFFLSIHIDTGTTGILSGQGQQRCKAIAEKLAARVRYKAAFLCPAPRPKGNKLRVGIIRNFR